MSDDRRCSRRVQLASLTPNLVGQTAEPISTRKVPVRFEVVGHAIQLAASLAEGADESRPMSFTERLGFERFARGRLTTPVATVRHEGQFQIGGIERGPRIAACRQIRRSTRDRQWTRLRNAIQGLHELGLLVRVGT